MVHIIKINILKTIYYAYFHSIINYGIIFGGNPSNRGRFLLKNKKKRQNYGW
jgi:hypothetical protein